MRKIKEEKLQTFMMGIMGAAGISEKIATPVVDGLLHASMRGVDSHGIRLLPHYLRAVKSGRINPNPNFQFDKTAAGTGRLHADHTFGHTAGVEGMKRAIELAKDAGIGAVSVRESTHFGAAAFFALMAPQHDMIGYSFTNTDALVVPTGSKRRFMGNSPLCFAAPCAAEEPFCLDMATSGVTWNKVLQHREENLPLEAQWCVDEDGIETTDPHKAAGLFPAANYKGYGLSVMVEMLCSVLGGMPFGPHIIPMFVGPIEAQRHLGHFFMAMRIDVFDDADEFKQRVQTLINELRNEPAADPKKPVMVAGDPEKITSAERSKDGIPVTDIVYDDFAQLGVEYGIEFVAS